MKNFSFFSSGLQRYEPLHYQQKFLRFFRAFFYPSPQHLFSKNYCFFAECEGNNLYIISKKIFLFSGLFFSSTRYLYNPCLIKRANCKFTVLHLSVPNFFSTPFRFIPLHTYISFAHRLSKNYLKKLPFFQSGGKDKPSIYITKYFLKKIIHRR